MSMNNTNRISNTSEVIDFGAHFYPEGLDTSNRPGSEVEERTGYNRIHDAETQIREMNAAGIDGAVQSMPYFLGHENLERTASANDTLLEVTKKHDELYGLASIPIVAGAEEAAREFKRSLDGGFQGGGIDETDVELTSKQLEPVFEIADQTSAPIFVHVPHLPNIEFRFNAVFGREMKLAQSICKVVHSEVFDSYPNLNLVWHHLGGNIASMLGRIHLHVDEGRWPKQENMRTFDDFKARLQNRVYIDTAGFFGYQTPIQTALEVFPASQILFGTDYPWEPRNEEELVEFVNAVRESTTKPKSDQILGGNALELLANV